MQYQSIILELLRQQPELHEQLRLAKSMSATVETQARQLRDRHLFWKDACSEVNPALDPVQIASMAFELALREVEQRLGTESALEASEPLTLEAAMEFLRRPSSPA